jgi:hypothetical protein
LGEYLKFVPFALNFSRQSANLLIPSICSMCKGEPTREIIVQALSTNESTGARWPLINKGSGPPSVTSHPRGLYTGNVSPIRKSASSKSAIFPE